MALPDFFVIGAPPVDRAHSNWTHLWSAGLEPGMVEAVPAENVTTHVTDSTRNRLVSAALRAGEAFDDWLAEAPGPRSSLRPAGKFGTGYTSIDDPFGVRARRRSTGR